jgi:RNA 3'-terminal phosphate cyclase (ATP)
MTAPVLVIDGSFGEGGGQILRTAAGLAAITGRPFRIEKIRAGRPKPGLGAQHLTAVRAVAAVCAAELSGDSLGSPVLEFGPRHRPRSADYEFDVAEAREGGSAGAATLVLQAVLPPLLRAEGDSTVTVRGGTHMAWSPPFDYLRDVWLAAVARMGADMEIDLRRSGWFPIGQGEIRAQVRSGGSATLRPLHLADRGELRLVSGRAIAADLPSHIAQRMADRASARLRAAGHSTDIVPERLRAACPGAGIFLTAGYEHVRCGFNALGRLGKPAEAVADEAVEALLRHHSSPAVVDEHLSDQLLVPCALADGISTLVVGTVSPHLQTNAWVIEKFGLARVATARQDNGATLVTVAPASTG